MGWMNSIFKVFLLILGFSDFLGLLPDSLDFVDKLLTLGLLAYFWFALRPTQFMFGKKSRKLDAAIIITYYILVLNTFFRFLQPFIPIELFEFISANLSIISLGFGSLFMILLAIYVSFFVELGEKSVIHCVSDIFNKKLFKKIKNKRLTKYSIIELILNFTIIYTIGIYFFALVNQWFVVSLDKSLLVVAVLFAVKDLETSKIKALNTLGEFDDLLLKKITELFTKKIYLAFGFLLIFHYLSDLSTFFLHYVTHLIPLDPYYALGANHLSLYSLFSIELFSFSTLATYILSALGIIFFILIPISILFFIIFNFNLKKVINKYQKTTIMVLVSMLIYTLGQWVTQRPIIGNEGIIGVDFITQKISETSFFSFNGLFMVAVITFIILYFSRRLIKEMFALAYLGSMMYFGTYVYNYFVSSYDFYISAIPYMGNFLKFNLYILLTLDFIFYFGSFILLVYISSRYIIKELIKDVLTDKLIIIWSILIITIPFIISFNFTAETIKLSSIAIATFLITSIAMFKVFKGREHRDDYLLSVNIIILAYHLLLLFLLFFDLGYLINTYIQPLFILFIGIIALKYFKLEVNFKFNVDIKNNLNKIKNKELKINHRLSKNLKINKIQNYKLNLFKIIKIIIYGLMFGALFYLVKEPVPMFDSILLIIPYSLLIAVSEEIMFRGVIYQLAKKAFKQAIYIQAIIFALIHIISFTNQGRSIFNIFAYLIVAFVFSIAAAKYTEKNSLLAPTIMHFVANIITVSFL